MSWWSHDGLTPVEREVHRQQMGERQQAALAKVIREGCSACRHREIEVFDGVWTCELGRAWPQRGICRGLEVEG